MDLVEGHYSFNCRLEGSHKDNYCPNVPHVHVLIPIRETKEPYHNPQYFLNTKSCES